MIPIIRNTRWLLGAFLAAGAVMAVLPPWQAMAAALSEGYQAEEDLPPGTLVAQLGESKEKVIAADNEHIGSLIGVVVAPGSSTLEVVGSDTTIQVATSGMVNALVSDIAGEIKAGDPITASPIKGIGMKALDSGRTVGIAKSDADNTESQTVNLKTKSGKTKTVHISSVPVMIEVSFFTPPPKKTPYPPILQNFADTIAGKSVAVIRVLIAGVIILLAIIVTAFMLFAAIRGSLISIGRNPLAKGTIYGALLQVIVTVSVVLSLAIGMAYLLVVL